MSVTFPLRYKRSDVEFYSKRTAGVIDAKSNYLWCRVLDMFEIYVLDSDKSITPHLIFDGYWESWVSTWFVNNIGKNDVFLDIGANTGYYAFAAHYLGAEVSIFEPNPVYAQMLRHSIKRNNYDLHVNEYALSNYNGEALLNVPLELHGSASLNDIIAGYETQQIKVEVKELDMVPARMKDLSKRLVLKIDAEGEEERILEGAQEILDSAERKVVLLEYTPGAYTEGFVDDLFSKWSVNWINHDGLLGAVTPGWVRAQTDWVMLVLQ